jgi:predicted small metal-binding protein
MLGQARGDYEGEFRMKQFECGSIVPGCDAVFRGDSEAAVLDQIGDHARDAHGMAEVPPEIEATIRANMHEVPEA